MSYIEFINVNIVLKQATITYPTAFYTHKYVLFEV